MGKLKHFGVRDVAYSWSILKRNKLYINKGKQYDLINEFNFKDLKSFHSVL